MAEPLSYDIRGNGPGLVLLHANSSTGAGSWGTVLDELAARYTVVLPNFPGSGGTPLPDGPIDPDTVADQVVDTAEKAGLDRFVLGGASLGGPVAIRVAARHPERVTRLVTYNGYAKPHPTLRLELELWASMLARGDSDVGKLLVSFTFSDAFLTAMTDEQVNALAAGMAAHAAPGTAAQVDLALRLDVRDDLGRIRVPTLVISATEDAHIPPSQSREIADGIAGARLVTVTGGHGSIIEDPKQTLSALLGFLD